MTEPTRNTTSYSSDTKNSNPVTLFLRHGKEPRLNEIADYTFTDVMLQDGTQVKDVTFDQLSQMVWKLINKS